VLYLSAKAEVTMLKSMMWKLNSLVVVPLLDPVALIQTQSGRYSAVFCVLPRSFRTSDVAFCRSLPHLQTSHTNHPNRILEPNS
jgi:hypothetical protein